MQVRPPSLLRDLAPSALPSLYRSAQQLTLHAFLCPLYLFASGPSSRTLFDAKAILPFDNASTGGFDVSAWPAEPSTTSDAASVLSGKDAALTMGALAAAMVVGGGLLV